MSFTFVPPDGYRNVTDFPTKPANETVFRDSMQNLLDQIRDFLNNSGFLPATGGTLSGDILFSMISSPYTTGIRYGNGTGWNLPFKNEDGTVVASLTDEGIVKVNGITLPLLTGGFVGPIKFGDGTGWKLPFQTNDGVTIGYLKDDGQLFLTSSLFQAWHAGNAGPFYRGAGSPEGVVTAAAGSIYQNTGGGASTTLYVKQSGSGNTGWVGK